MEEREIVKLTILFLNSNNFGIQVIYFVAGISKHVGKYVPNMVIPEGETEDEKNKQIVDFGNTDDLVYSLLMEVCFKHPETMLGAANSTVLNSQILILIALVIFLEQFAIWHLPGVTIFWI